MTDPDRFGGALVPVAADVSARDDGSGGFSADIHAARLRHLGLFSVHIEGARVFRAPSDYIAITVPLDFELRFFGDGDVADYPPGSAHILWANSPMDLQIAQASSLLVATYPMAWLREVWGTEAVRGLAAVRARGDALSLQKAAGRSFWRHLNYLWSEVCNDAAFLRSDPAAGAMEDCSARLFLLAIEEDGVGPAAELPKVERDRCLDLAERYILENLSEELSLSDLVTASEASASTVLRAFRLHRGTTPMRYAKQLRLEAVQRALLAAGPSTATVTEVATEFSFYQLGRFASDYRRAFGELPSETLAR